MAESFSDYLRSYYLRVAEVLRGEAEAASVFPNSSDKGNARERIYIDFLRQHVPSKCTVFAGGYLFDDDGAMSKQLDIIVITDTTPQFNLLNKDGAGKSFSPVEGTVAVVSVKSCLDKKQLHDALWGFASIPATRPLTGRGNPFVQFFNYEHWPLKIIYASDGISVATFLGHLNDFYTANDEIPFARRPDIVHVAGKYLVMRNQLSSSLSDAETGEPVESPAEYLPIVQNADLHAIALVTHQIQQHATATTHIAFGYAELVNKVVGPITIEPITRRIYIGGRDYALPPEPFDPDLK